MWVFEATVPGESASLTRHCNRLVPNRHPYPCPQRHMEKNRLLRRVYSSTVDIQEPLHIIVHKLNTPVHIPYWVQYKNRAHGVLKAIASCNLKIVDHGIRMSLPCVSNKSYTGRGRVYPANFGERAYSLSVHDVWLVSCVPCSLSLLRCFQVFDGFVTHDQGRVVSDGADPTVDRRSNEETDHGPYDGPAFPPLQPP